MLGDVVVGLVAVGVCVHGVFTVVVVVVVVAVGVVFVCVGAVGGVVVIVVVVVVVVVVVIVVVVVDGVVVAWFVLSALFVFSLQLLMLACARWWSSWLFVLQLSWYGVLSLVSLVSVFCW